MTDEPMSSADFFDVVDELLTPRMADLGYHRIGGDENDQPPSRGRLTTSANRPRAAVAGSPSSLRYDFGFEAGNDGVRRLVEPDDPPTADELWLSYSPADGELDLSAWESIARGRVDWDPRTDRGPCGSSEVRRRLADIGRAVADLARLHGGPASGS